MTEEYLKLNEYVDQSNRTIAVTGAGISYLYGMRRLKQSVGPVNARRFFPPRLSVRTRKNFMKS